MSILFSLFVLSLVITIHEFGHYFVARLFGVSVPIFSIGMGPRLCGFNYKGTNFRISLLPIGGYAQMKDESHNSKLIEPDSYPAKPRWQKFLIVAAGPAINFASAFVVACIALSIYPIPMGTNTISRIEYKKYLEDYPLKPGDKIVSVNDYKTRSAQDIINALNLPSSDDYRELAIIRNDSPVHITLQRDLVTYINFYQEPKRLSPTDAVTSVTGATSDFLAMQTEFFEKLFSGHKEVAKDLSGPVGIINMGRDVIYGSGLIEGSAIFAFYISLALGFINLLPIPVFDGGQLVILGIEMTIRRDINLTIKKYLLIVGVIFIITIFLFASYNDISRLL